MGANLKPSPRRRRGGFFRSIRWRRIRRKAINARKGRTTLGGASAWTKRNKKSGEFMAVKKPTKNTKAAKKFKGVRREKK